MSTAIALEAHGALVVAARSFACVDLGDGPITGDRREAGISLAKVSL